MGVHDGHRRNLRQRFLSCGLDAFEDHEILEMLLFYAIPRKNTNPTAHELINYFGSLYGVFNASADDLMSRDGIGENAAILLKLLPEISRRVRLPSRGTVLPNLKAVGRYLVELFRGEREEIFYQLCFNQQRKLILCRKIGSGDASSSRMDMRELLRNALTPGVDCVVISHNHPSGDITPSSEDYDLTTHVQKALRYANIALWDHIIVSDDRYVSLRGAGFFVR